MVEKEFQELFKQYDTDHSGFIDAKEAEVMMKDLTSRGYVLSVDNVPALME